MKPELLRNLLLLLLLLSTHRIMYYCKLFSFSNQSHSMYLQHKSCASISFIIGVHFETVRVQALDNTIWTSCPGFGAHCALHEETKANKNGMIPSRLVRTLGSGGMGERCKEEKKQRNMEHSGGGNRGESRQNVEGARRGWRSRWA